jgi:hypothetical protein
MASILRKRTTRSDDTKKPRGRPPKLSRKNRKEIIDETAKELIECNNSDTDSDIDTIDSDSDSDQIPDPININQTFGPFSSRTAIESILPKETMVTKSILPKETVVTKSILPKKTTQSIPPKITFIKPTTLTTLTTLTSLEAETKTSTPMITLTLPTTMPVSMLSASLPTAMPTLTTSSSSTSSPSTTSSSSTSTTSGSSSSSSSSSITSSTPTTPTVETIVKQHKEKIDATLKEIKNKINLIFKQSKIYLFDTKNLEAFKSRMQRILIISEQMNTTEIMVAFQQNTPLHALLHAYTIIIENLTTLFNVIRRIQTIIPKLKTIAHIDMQYIMNHVKMIKDDQIFIQLKQTDIREVLTLINNTISHITREKSITQIEHFKYDGCIPLFSLNMAATALHRKIDGIYYGLNQIIDKVHQCIE